MEGANEAEVVTRVILNGTAYLVSVAGKSALSVLGFLATAAGTGIVNGVRQKMSAEKTAGQAKLASLLKSGKELKLFTFKENQIEEFKAEAKRYGIVYSMVKRSDRDKAEGVYDVLCKAEDAVRLQRILERMGVADVAVSATGKEAAGAEEESGEIRDARELLAQMLQPDERTQNPVQAAENESQSAASSNYMEADADLSARRSVSASISDIKEHMNEYQPEKKEIQNGIASMLAEMLKPADSTQMRNEEENHVKESAENPAGQFQKGNASESMGITGEMAEEIAKEYEAFINSLNKSGQERGKE